MSFFASLFGKTKRPSAAPSGASGRIPRTPEEEAAGAAEAGVEVFRQMALTRAAALPYLAYNSGMLAHAYLQLNEHEESANSARSGLIILGHFLEAYPDAHEEAFKELSATMRQGDIDSRRMLLRLVELYGDGCRNSGQEPDKSLVERAGRACDFARQSPQRTLPWPRESTAETRALLGG